MSEQPTLQTNGNHNGGVSNLVDGLGVLSAATTRTNVVNSNNDNHSFDPLEDILGGVPKNSQKICAEKAPPLVTFDKNGLKLTFTFPMVNTEETEMLMTAENTGSSAISEFLFEAAVPKAFQLQMQPPSGDCLPAFGSVKVTQKMVVKNQQKQPLRMRMRINYFRDGQKYTEQVDENKFPPTLWQ